MRRFCACPRLFYRTPGRESAHDEQYECPEKAGTHRALGHSLEPSGLERKAQMATEDIIAKIDEAHAKAEALSAKGADLLKQKVQKVSDAASQLATKVVHSAQETAQKAVHRTQEVATAAQHRLEEKGILPSDKPKQK